MRERKSQRGKEFGNRPGGGGKCMEKRKKILNRRNELNKSFRINKSSKKRTQNELVFECKKGQADPKIQVLYGILLEFDAPGLRVTGYTKSFQVGETRAARSARFAKLLDGALPPMSRFG